MQLLQCSYTWSVQIAPWSSARCGARMAHRLWWWKWPGILALSLGWHPIWQPPLVPTPPRTRTRTRTRAPSWLRWPPVTPLRLALRFKPRQGSIFAPASSRSTFTFPIMPTPIKRCWCCLPIVICRSWLTVVSRRRRRKHWLVVLCSCLDQDILFCDRCSLNRRCFRSRCDLSGSDFRRL